MTDSVGASFEASAPSVGWSGAVPFDAAGATDTIGTRHTSLRAQVLVELRRRIINGDYRPGERLREERLAADFGVSRNPVREALRVVEAEGFVRVEPRRGAVVAHPDEAALDDLFGVRAMLEPRTARLAAARASDSEIAGLRDILTASRDAADAGDYVRLAEFNSRFHLRIAELSGNRWLHTFATAVYNHVQWVFRQGASRRATHSWAEHVCVLEALEAHDPDAAERAASAHVHAARRAAEVQVSEGTT